jgi:hypothetical protein
MIGFLSHTLTHTMFLQRLHPAGLQPDWADKLYGKVFVSDTNQSTHEHYLQVCLLDL